MLKMPSSQINTLPYGTTLIHIKTLVLEPWLFGTTIGLDKTSQTFRSLIFNVVL